MKKILIITTAFVSLSMSAHAFDVQSMYDKVMSDAKKNTAREATKEVTKEGLK